MSDFRSMLRNAVAANFGQSVPLKQEAIEYLTSIADILGKMGVICTRFDRADDDVILNCVILDVPEQISFEIWHKGDSAGNINAIRRKLQGRSFDVIDRNFGNGHWNNRDKFISDILGKWISENAPESVIKTVYPDRVPVKFAGVLGGPI